MGDPIPSAPRRWTIPRLSPGCPLAVAVTGGGGGGGHCLPGRGRPHCSACRGMVRAVLCCAVLYHHMMTVRELTVRCSTEHDPAAAAAAVGEAAGGASRNLVDLAQSVLPRQAPPKPWPHCLLHSACGAQLPAVREPIRVPLCCQGDLASLERLLIRSDQLSAEAPTVLTVGSSSAAAEE